MSSEDIENVIKMSKLVETSMTSRGGIIQFSTSIENTLNDIIAWCFYPSKYIENEDVHDLLNNNGIMLESIILWKLSFQKKIELFEDLIFTRYPNIWENNTKSIRNICKELKKVNAFRNTMAHSPSDLSREFLGTINSIPKGNIADIQVIVRTKGKFTTKKITKKEIEIEIMRAVKAWFMLSQLFSQINNDDKSVKESEVIIQMISDYL